MHKVMLCLMCGAFLIVCACRIIARSAQAQEGQFGSWPIDGCDEPYTGDGCGAMQVPLNPNDPDATCGEYLEPMYPDHCQEGQYNDYCTELQLKGCACTKTVYCDPLWALVNDSPPVFGWVCDISGFTYNMQIEAIDPAVCNCVRDEED